MKFEVFKISTFINLYSLLGCVLKMALTCGVRQESANKWYCNTVIFC